MIHDTESAKTSQNQDVHVIMKCIYNHEINVPSPLSPNGFVAAHALGYMMYGYTLLMSMNQRFLNKLIKERNINGHK